ncbi:MAG: hypothetical protein A2X30_12595 [Elusimicrobia bacterium GWB2_63_16]|nr:MAG: hypothetical protein A2X30_12595 [Elusimicrobia bacterium GWB2_63_16]
MKNAFNILLLLSVCCLPAAAQQPAAPSAVRSTAPAPGGYDYGMLQYRQGDQAGAKLTFMNLLLANPAGAGALEGLSLSCIALGQYEEAAVYLEQWNAQSPGNQYVLSLLARARGGMNDDKGALRAYAGLAALDPRNCSARQRVDSLSERAGAAIFPRARAYRSVSLESLATANPQRIIYEGSSAGARFRTPLLAGLDIFGGADLRTDAQRNAGRGFTYFEIQEQAYSAGLSGRYGKDLYWEGEYGQSLFSDIASPGGEQLSMGRARAALRRRSSSMELISQPRLVRVSGGSHLYRIPRENSVRAETAGPLLGWDWTARGGLSSLAGGTTLGSLGLRGLKDYGAYGFSAGYSHGQQEFYSAAASGRLRYVHADRFSVGVGRGQKEVYRAGATLGRSFFSDGNRLSEADGYLTAWLPWQKEFWGGYRFAHLNFTKGLDGYDTLDETGHWLSAGWRRCAGYNWSADAGYEHGYVTDKLMSYHADLYTAGAEWYSGRGSLRLQGRRRTTGGRGHSWSAGLQARYNF